ncbi:unnamed protein product [Closterium sp. Naga37s-1]|nr:unnamed protein product [Closterium sp. Naga37s-1]
MPLRARVRAFLTRRILTRSHPRSHFLVHTPLPPLHVPVPPTPPPNLYLFLVALSCRPVWQAFLRPAPSLPAPRSFVHCPLSSLSHSVPPPPRPASPYHHPHVPPLPCPQRTSSTPPPAFPTSTLPSTPLRAVLPSPASLSPPPPPISSWAAPLHPVLPGPSVTHLPPPGSTPPFPPTAKLYTPCPCSLCCPAPFSNLPLPFLGTRPPFFPPANLYTPCYCPLCLPTPFPNPPQSPPSPVPSIFPPPVGLASLLLSLFAGEHIGVGEGRAWEKLATDAAREGVSEVVGEGAAEAAEERAVEAARKGAAEAAWEGAAKVAKEGTAKATQEGAAEAAIEGQAEAGGEGAAKAAKEGPAADMERGSGGCRGKTSRGCRAEAAEEGAVGAARDGAAKAAEDSKGVTAGNGAAKVVMGAAEAAPGAAEAAVGMAVASCRAAKPTARVSTPGRVSTVRKASEVRAAEGSVAGGSAMGGTAREGDEGAAEHGGESKVGARESAAPAAAGESAAGAATREGTIEAASAAVGKKARAEDAFMEVKSAAGGAVSDEPAGKAGARESWAARTGEVGFLRGAGDTEQEAHENLMHIDGPLVVYLTLASEANPPPPAMARTSLPPPYPIPPWQGSTLMPPLLGVPPSTKRSSQGAGIPGGAMLPDTSQSSPANLLPPAPPGTTKTKLANGGGTEAKEAKGPIPTGQQPNSHFPPVSAPPQDRGNNSAHSLSGHLSLLNPPQVAATAYAAGMGADGMRDEPMATPPTPIRVDAKWGKGQGGSLAQGPHPSSAQPVRPIPPSTLPLLLPSPAGRLVAGTPQEPSSSLPSPMETDLVLRPCHSHPDVVAPPSIQPVAYTLSVTQEGTSIRYEAPAAADAPPSRVAEPPVGPHLADGEGHTTACTSDAPLHPPFLAPGPVLPRGPAPSPNPPLLPVPLAPPVDAPHSRGAPVSTPVMDVPPQVPPDDDLPSTASSDDITPNDPADTITSPEHPVRCPTRRCTLESTRALGHHTPFCHPADAACWAQAVHDTTSILPSLSLPRATGIQLTDAQWQTLDSMDWTGYFSPERIHARPLRRVPEKIRGGYLDVLSAILAHIAQDPEAARPTFLLAAASTLFLAPATPPDRSHTAAITTRIAHFGQELRFRSELLSGGACFGGRACPSHLSLAPCPFDFPSGRRCRSVVSVGALALAGQCSSGQAVDDMTVPHNAPLPSLPLPHPRPAPRFPPPHARFLPSLHLSIFLRASALFPLPLAAHVSSIPELTLYPLCPFFVFPTPIAFPFAVLRAGKPPLEPPTPLCVRLVPAAALAAAVSARARITWLPELAASAGSPAAASAVPPFRRGRSAPPAVPSAHPPLAPPNHAADAVPTAPRRQAVPPRPFAPTAHQLASSLPLPAVPAVSPELPPAV